MNLIMTHARAVLITATSSEEWWKGGLLVLSVGFALSCAMLVAADLDLLFLLFFGLSLAAVPLWRGLLWTSDEPGLLPLRPRVAAAVEGGLFALLSLLPMSVIWAALWWAIHDTALSAEQASIEMFAQAATVGGLFVVTAPAIALLPPRRVPLVLWTILAIPGLAGVLLSFGLITDGSVAILYYTMTSTGLVLALLAVVGAMWLARRLTARQETAAAVRPGRLDRLTVDTRRHLVRSILLSGVLTLGTWLLLHEVVSAVEPAHNPINTWYGGLLVVLPLLPRLLLMTERLGIRQSEVPSLAAWALLPVHPDALRARLMVLMIAPLAAGIAVDVGAALLLTDSLQWISTIALVHILASLLCGALLGGLTLARLPRTPRPRHS